MYIAIDGGGTKTEYLLLDKHFQVVDHYLGGCLNHDLLGNGWADVSLALKASIDVLLERNGLTVSDIEAVAAGISGWILPGISCRLMRVSLQLVFPVFLQLMMDISPLQPRTRLRGEFLLIVEQECAVRQLILQVTGSNWPEWMNGQGTQGAETGL